MRKAYFLITIILFVCTLILLTACITNEANGSFGFQPVVSSALYTQRPKEPDVTAAPTPASVKEYDFDTYVGDIDFANRLFSYIGDSGEEKTFLYDEASFSDTDAYIDKLVEKGFKIATCTSRPEKDLLCAEMQNEADGVTIEVNYEKGGLTVAVIFTCSN